MKHNDQKMGTSPIEMGEIDGHAGHVEYIYIYIHIFLLQVYFGSTCFPKVKRTFNCFKIVSLYRVWGTQS